jgi:meso-butanediol dehydrogenase/(S,S)-butanediol dehydrogenase/diacetyl reductase
VESRLAGKAAVITAAGGGIGRAVALRMAHEGAQLVLNDLDADALARTIDEICSAGASARGEAGDVAEADVLEDLVELAVREYGRLDVLHNNAGIGIPAPLHEIRNEDWRLQFAVSVDAAFYATRAALPVMRAAGGGSIINTASGAALAAEPRLGAYTAAKHALLGLTRATAVENAAFGVRANAICPGTVLTPAIQRVAAGIPGGLDAYATAHPQRRLGTAEEVAGLVAFLASDDATHLNGAVIPIDGGISAARAAPAISGE